MPALVGQLRRRIVDLGSTEYDLAASYDDPVSGTYTTIYIFHPGLESVAIWFDRVRVASVSRLQNGLPDGAAAPQGLAVHAGGIADGLRLAIPLKNGSNKSTAIAVAPMDDWLLVVRMSSPSLDANALDGKLTTMLADIRWPAASAKSFAAAPVEACVDQLTFKRARLKQADLTQALIGSAVLNAAAKQAKEKAEKLEPARFCHDREGPNGEWGLYRNAAARDSYVLALGDAGRAITVARSFSNQLGLDNSSGSYSVSFLDLDSVMQFPDFDRMPSPEQAIALATQTRPISTTSQSGGQSTVTLNSALVRPK
jgi:hypothetical protein